MSDVIKRGAEQDDMSMLSSTLQQDITFTGLDPWLSFISQVYSYETVRFTVGSQRTTGVLSMAQIAHPLFGKYLLSAPFGSYGGFAFETVQDRNNLLLQAEQFVRDRKLDYALVRFKECEGAPPETWKQQALYRTYITDISVGEDALMRSFSSNHRNHIRKSAKRGFTIRFGGLEILDDAYEGLSLGMHELGSPWHGKNYIRAMAVSLGESLRFAVVYDTAKVVAGAGIFVTQDKTVTNLYANVSRKYRAVHVGEFFYWSVIQHYYSLGMLEFDMGRSLIGSGNEVFKMKWNPRISPLAYWYHLGTAKEVPHLNQNNAKFQAAIWLWKRLPKKVVRALGPHIIRGIA